MSHDRPGGSDARTTSADPAGATGGEDGSESDSWSGRYDPSGDDSSGDGLTDESGSFDREVVLDAATPVLERWQRERTLGSVRKRLRRLLVASAFVALLGLVVEPPGLTGFLLQVWSLASIPIAAITGALYATLRDPKQARSVWWDSGLVVTVGLISLAALSRSSQRSAYGRAAWQLLFGDDSPTGPDYRFDRDDDGVVDLARVAEIRRWVRNVVGLSLLVAGVETAFRLYGDEIIAGIAALLSGESVAGGAGSPLPDVPLLSPSSPLEYVVLVAIAALVGVVVGFFIAVRRDL